MPEQVVPVMLAANEMELLPQSVTGIDTDIAEALADPQQDERRCIRLAFQERVDGDPEREEYLEYGAACHLDPQLGEDGKEEVPGFVEDKIHVIDHAVGFRRPHRPDKIGP